MSLSGNEVDRCSASLGTAFTCGHWSALDSYTCMCKICLDKWYATPHTRLFTGIDVDGTVYAKSDYTLVA